MDFYGVLGLSKDVDEDTIKKTYRRLAKEYHPDRNPNNPDAEKKFKQIAEAYEVLSDPEKRKEYDTFGSVRPKNGDGGFDPFSGFGNFNFNGGPQRRTRMEVPPVHTVINIELMEAIKGCKKTIDVDFMSPCEQCSGTGGKTFKSCESCGGKGGRSMMQGPFTIQFPCPDCNGQGKSIDEKCTNCNDGNVLASKNVEISIPEGIDDDITMRLRGQGVTFKGQTGDLLVTIKIAPDEFITKLSNNLVFEYPVNYSQLLLGAEISIPFLGEVLSCTIPKGSQPGYKLRLKGKGCKSFQHDKIGDLFVVLQLEIPTEFTVGYNKVLNKLSELENGNLTPRRKNLENRIKNGH